MKKNLYYIENILFYAVLWIILNESISIIHIISGIILGLLSIFITDRFLLTDGYKNTYKVRPYWLFKYFLYIIIQIYISGFVTIIKIISGKINPDIVEIETEIKNDIYICLLANSITLTPGTVTIDKTGQRLKVLWIDCITKDTKKAGEIIKGNFEKFLLKE